MTDTARLAQDKRIAELRSVDASVEMADLLAVGHMDPVEGMQDNWPGLAVDRKDFHSRYG